MKKIPPEQINLKEIYASNFLHTALWSFVTAQKLLGIDLSQSIRSFKTYFGVDDLEDGTLRQVFYRKNEEYKKCVQGISADARCVFREEEIDKMLNIVKASLQNGR
jgi:hypothetical protein